MLRAYLRLVRMGLALGASLPIVAFVCFQFTPDPLPLDADRSLGFALAGLACVIATVAIRPAAIRPTLQILLVFFSLPAVLGLLGVEADVFGVVDLFDLTIVAFAPLATLALAWQVLRRLEAPLAEACERQADFIDAIPRRWVSPAIVGAAALSLALELAVIRWQASILEFFAFYKNLSLLACFAGLGLGYALAGARRMPLLLAVPLLLWQVALVFFVRYGLPREVYANVMLSPVTEQLNMGYEVATTVAHYTAIYVCLAAVLFLTLVTFIPIGQLCGRTMTMAENLPAYGLNLMGSLLGVIVMLGLSMLWTPPVIWFGLCALLLLPFVARRVAPALFVSAASIALLLLLAWPFSFGSEVVYSPYQKLERRAGRDGRMMITAAGHYFQRVLDLSLADGKRELDPYLQAFADYYDLPYRVFEGRPSVAVVGAGAGNDVAAALRGGAHSVHAIEIDPAIMALGERYHPEKPYSNPIVRSIVDDARSFFRTTDETFDIIVFGLLDSHALLSHGASIRLDSFVYTIEGLREARERLRPGGLLFLSFSIPTFDMGRKIYEMMEEAFDGSPPVMIMTHYDFAMVYMQRREGGLAIDPETLADAGLKIDPWGLSEKDPDAAPIDLSTDDWPFFYMPHRVYPVSYLGVLALLFALTVLAVGSFAGQAPQWSHLTFFFLGAGFMLVEAKAITELGLLFGNTWQVIGFVSAGALAMAWLANAFASRFHLRGPLVPFLLVLAALGVGYGMAGIGGFPPSPLGKVAAIALLTCPVFFSGLAFSTILRGAPNVSGVMATNILGVMLGGLLEYNSMYFGFRFLYLLAIVLYALGMASHFVLRRSGGARSP